MCLERLGHKATIINAGNKQEIVDAINQCRPDIVHLHYDQDPFVQTIGETDVPVKIFTSHWPYLTSKNPFGYIKFFDAIKNNFYYFALSANQVKTYVAYGCDSSKVFMAINGTDCNQFLFHENPTHRDRSIYLGIVVPRKGQHRYQAIDSVDFVGPLRPYPEFDETHKNYLGEWTREHLHKHLSDYANLVLLSDGESAAPLVILEAMACGLGLVINTSSTPNLDTSMPWISVIPDDKLDDPEFVEAEITRNRKISLLHRKQIRAYAIENFSWEKLVPRYANLCIQLHALASKGDPPPCA